MITQQFRSNTLASVPRRWIWAMVIGGSMCQPISAVAYSALVANRQDAIYRSIRANSLRPCHRGRRIIPFARYMGNSFWGASFSRPSNSIKLLGGSTFANLQPSRFSEFNQTYRRDSPSTCVRPISKALKGVRRPIPIVAPAEELATNKIR